MFTIYKRKSTGDHLTKNSVENAKGNLKGRINTV